LFQAYKQRYPNEERTRSPPDFCRKSAKVDVQRVCFSAGCFRVSRWETVSRQPQQNSGAGAFSGHGDSLPGQPSDASVSHMLQSHWTTWYRHRRWKRIRARQLAIEPLCRLCKLDGRVTPANIVDHVERHFGDPQKFWNGKLQSVCRSCHEVRKKFIEARGFSRDVDPLTGWPKDPQHPANLPRSAFKRFGFGIPHNLQRSKIPVTLICGPPAAGKSTWVETHRQPGDVVISLDECKLKVGGRMWDIDRRIWRRALAYRDAMLRTLAMKDHGQAFVVVGAPTQAERDAWCAALGVTPDRVIVLATPADECIRRLRADPARAHAVPDLTNGVQRWWHLHRQPERIRAA
jgi:5-methylcytosine-specific restriction protein A